MWNRDIVTELAKHLDVEDITRLAQSSRYISSVTQQDLMWKNIYENYFSTKILEHDSYRNNFKFAWELEHPQNYSLLMWCEYYGYCQPLGVFNTADINLVATTIIEIYDPDQKSFFNIYVSSGINYANDVFDSKDFQGKVAELKRSPEKLVAVLNNEADYYLALITIPV